MDSDVMSREKIREISNDVKAVLAVMEEIKQDQEEIKKLLKAK